MYEFWYDYIKQKYGKKQNFIVYTKQMIFINIWQKMLKMELILQIMLQIYHYQRKKEKVIGLMNDELGGKIISKFVGLGAKTYIYLTDNG